MSEQTRWRIEATSADGDHPASHAIDDDLHTCWRSARTAALPQQLTIDLGELSGVAGIRYVQCQDDEIAGRIKEFTVSASDDGRTWTEIARGESAAEPAEYVIRFAPVSTRYLAFAALSEHGPANRIAAVAEIDVVRHGAAGDTRLPPPGPQLATRPGRSHGPLPRSH